MNVKIPVVRVVCGNEKCQHMCDDPAIEINFYTKDIHYVCPKCKKDSKVSLMMESKPLPRMRVKR